MYAYTQKLWLYINVYVPNNVHKQKNKYTQYITKVNNEREKNQSSANVFSEYSYKHLLNSQIPTDYLSVIEVSIDLVELFCYKKK